MTKLTRIGMYLFLICAVVVMIFPFYWMIISSTNPTVLVTQGHMLPGDYLIKNWNSLLNQADIFPAFWNSIKISVISTLLAVFVGSLAGYGFVVYRSKGKDVVFSIILLSMMIPFAAIMIPLFRMFGKLSEFVPIIGIDTSAAVILPSIASAFLIFFFRQSTKMFPKELLEAGRIDGLNEFGIFARIYFPTMRSTFAAAAIITFMSSWNNYMWPLVVLQSPKNMTLPLLISSIGSAYFPDYAVMMLLIVLATIPTGVIFFVMQKQFVQGMIGSVK